MRSVSQIINAVVLDHERRFVKGGAVFKLEFDSVAVILHGLISRIGKLCIAGIIGSHHIAHFDNGQMRIIMPAPVVKISGTEIHIKLSVVVEKRRHVDIVKSVAAGTSRGIIFLTRISVLNIEIYRRLGFVQGFAVKISARTHFEAARRIVADGNAKLIFGRTDRAGHLGHILYTAEIHIIFSVLGITYDLRRPQVFGKKSLFLTAFKVDRQTEFFPVIEILGAENLKIVIYGRGIHVKISAVFSTLLLAYPNASRIRRMIQQKIVAVKKLRIIAFVVGNSVEVWQIINRRIRTREAEKRSACHNRSNKHLHPFSQFPLLRK